MKKYLTNSLLALAILLGTGVAVAQPAYGRDGSDDTMAEATETETEHATSTASGSSSSGSLTEAQRQERATRIENEREKLVEAKKKAESKVLNAKQKVCTNRETEIKNVLTQVSTRATNHIAVLNKIADRTKEFYVTKGKTLANYDQLVADVDAKKAAAEQSVTNLKAIAEVFTCNVDNPQASIQAVRDALHAKRDAMQAYRESVKNLIVGVKSVQGETSATEKKEVQ